MCVLRRRVEKEFWNILIFLHANTVNHNRLIICVNNRDHRFREGESMVKRKGKIRGSGKVRELKAEKKGNVKVKERLGEIGRGEE